MNIRWYEFKTNREITEICKKTVHNHCYKEQKMGILWPCTEDETHKDSKATDKMEYNWKT